MGTTSTATSRHRQSGNVSQPERLASIVGGGTLIGFGKRGPGRCGLNGIWMRPPLAFYGAKLKPKALGLPSGSKLAAKPFSVREAAAFLGVSTALVYRLCETGKLGHFRIESVIRIPLDALEQFLISTRRAP